MWRRSLLAVGLSAIVVSPLAAQSKGTWELGAFGRYNWYDKSFSVSEDSESENSFGGGGRVGYFFSPKFSLELDGSFNPTDLDSTESGLTSIGMVYMPFHLRALYHAPLGDSWAWMIGGGPNYNRYRVSDEADDFTGKKFNGSDWGIGGLTGFRWKLSETWSLRADGTLDYIPSPNNTKEENGGTGDANIMLGAQLGLSVYLGGGCTDKLDSIRVEPRNATVMVGETVNYRLIGYMCDGTTTDAAAASAGTIAAGAGGTLTGTTFSSNQPGTFTISFDNPNARRARTASATVTVNPRPAPPAATLTRVDLQPDNASVVVGQAVALRVMGFYSDGTSRALTNCQLTPDGGTITGGSFSSDVAGSYTVTAVCEGGQRDRSTINVRSLVVTFRALFEFNRTEIYIQSEVDSLRSVAQVLRDNPSINISIFGHTDSVGSDAYNCQLGWRRIQAVVDSLRSFGVDANRLAAYNKTSFGERAPVVSNSTSEGRDRNRRVEIFTAGAEEPYTARACAPPQR